MSACGPDYRSTGKSPIEVPPMLSLTFQFVVALSAAVLLIWLLRDDDDCRHLLRSAPAGADHTWQ